MEENGDHLYQSAKVRIVYNYFAVNLWETLGEISDVSSKRNARLTALFSVDP